MRAAERPTSAALRWTEESVGFFFPFSVDMLSRESHVKIRLTETESDSDSDIVKGGAFRCCHVSTAPVASVVPFCMEQRQRQRHTRKVFFELSLEYHIERTT